MGNFADPRTMNNVGPLGGLTNPLTGTALARDRENQKALLELTGTQEWEPVSILDGNITPTKAEIIVSAEGGDTSDDLVSINTASDGSTTLHTGMLVKLRAADPGQTITVKHGSGKFNIQTTDSQDVILGVSWSLELKLGSDNIWREQASRDRQIAESAKTSADNAQATANAAQVTANAAKLVTDTVTSTPTANAVPQADANGKLDGGWLRSSTLVAPGVVQLSSTVSSTEETKAATPKGILNALKEKELSARYDPGNWTITDVIVGIPLHIVMWTPGGSDNDNISIVAVSGATDMQVTTNNWPWSMGRSTAWSSGNSLWVLPTSSTVIFNLTRANDLAVAKAYQAGHGG